MSWFRVPWTRRDNDFLKFCKEKFGEVPFFDEMNANYMPYPKEWLPIPIYVTEKEKVKKIITKSSNTYEYISALSVTKLDDNRRKQIPLSIRKKLLAERGTHCEVCSISKYHHIHHRDGDPSNNLLSNLLLVCIDCHKDFHKRQSS